MDFLLLQINDSAFPIGSYTHSFGLESYIQLGNIKTKQDALCYIQANLHTQMLYTDLLAIALIFQAKEDLEKILEIESIIHISTSPKELREGYLKLGSRFIKTIQKLPLKPNAFFEKYLKMSKTAMHATAYGVFCAAYDKDYHAAIRHYLYAQTSNLITNCVKSIPLSQHDGQVILSLLHGEFEQICQKLEHLKQEDLCTSSMHYDIKAMQHEYLYSRLYMS